MMEFEDDHEEEEEEEEEDSELAITPTFKKHPPQQPPSTTVRYRECLKNHAVGIGGHAVDGCGEFMPAGADGSLDALRCAACNCHRNFHRKELVYDSNNISNTSSAFNQQLTLYTPRAHSGPPPPHHHHQVYQFYPYNRTTTPGGGSGGGTGGGYHLHRPLALPSPTTPGAGGASTGGAGAGAGGGVTGASGGNIQPHRGSNHHGEEGGVVMGGGENVVGGGSGGSTMMMMMSSGGSSGGSGSMGKKRFRTKFTQEQKDKMLSLAEKLGWKIQKQDEEVVQHFCLETGVKRHVLKVWMHNNKHTLGKKP